MSTGMQRTSFGTAFCTWKQIENPVKVRRSYWISRAVLAESRLLAARHLQGATLISALSVSWDFHEKGTALVVRAPVGAGSLKHLELHSYSHPAARSDWNG